MHEFYQFLVKWQQKSQSKIGKTAGMEAMIENMFYLSPVKFNKNLEYWLKFRINWSYFDTGILVEYAYMLILVEI